MSGYSKLQSIIADQSTERLIAVAKSVSIRQDEESDLVLVKVLEELEHRMTEDEYIEFCDSL